MIDTSEILLGVDMKSSPATLSAEQMVQMRGSSEVKRERFIEIKKLDHTRYYIGRKACKYENQTKWAVSNVIRGIMSAR